MPFIARIFLFFAFIDNFSVPIPPSKEPAPSIPFLAILRVGDPPIPFCGFRGIALEDLIEILFTWMRDFQTLPGRVHPQMYMSTTSGYILSGVYAGGVESIEEPLTFDLPEAKKARMD